MYIILKVRIFSTIGFTRSEIQILFSGNGTFIVSGAENSKFQALQLVNKQDVFALLVPSC
jgi:hypothetical protein